MRTVKTSTIRQCFETKEEVKNPKGNKMTDPKISTTMFSFLHSIEDKLKKHHINNIYIIKHKYKNIRQT